MFPSWNPAQPAITDLIVQHDPETLKRLPVSTASVIDVFSRFGNHKAVRAVRALPGKDGWLDDRGVDAVLVTVHWEMQRLAEEFYHGHRVWGVLSPLIASVRSTGFRETLRIVDVGCGIGYTTRWLAARIPVAEQNIELIGDRSELDADFRSQPAGIGGTIALPVYPWRRVFSRACESYIFVDRSGASLSRRSAARIPETTRTAGNAGVSALRFSTVASRAFWIAVFSSAADADGDCAARRSAFGRAGV